MVILMHIIHSYPQQFTKKKVAKKKVRQHHDYYSFFLFYTITSTPNTNNTALASVTFLNELTGIIDSCELKVGLSEVSCIFPHLFLRGLIYFLKNLINLCFFRAS